MTQQFLEKNNVAKDFTWEELSCPCGQCSPIVDRDFITKLQAMRTEFGEPMIVNSWYRCEVHNRKVKGKINSQHLLGKAVDISTVGWPDEKKYQFLWLVIAFGFKGIGIYKTYIHLDMRTGIRVLWVDL